MDLCPKAQQKNCKMHKFISFISAPYQIYKFKTRQRKKGHEKESNFLNIYITFFNIAMEKKTLKRR
jgi:hypothetical protein